MGRTLKTASFRTLLSAMVAVSFVGSLCGQTSDVPNPTAGKADFRESSDRGSAPADGLDVRIHPEEGKLKPAADLLLYDPQGRKTGKARSANRAYQEIPSSSYERESLSDDTSGSRGPVTAVIYVRNPAAGEYRLQVVGRFTGKYDLEIAGEDSTGNPSRVAFTNVKILSGNVHRYVISYPNSPEAKLAVRSE